METEHVLTVHCAESPGIVHAITGYLLDHNCDIIDTKHFGDRQAKQFFMRVHFASGNRFFSTGELRRDFEPLAESRAMKWQLEPHGRKRRVMVMVSRFGHCLNDLLYRARTGEPAGGNRGRGLQSHGPRGTGDVARHPVLPLAGH